MLVAAAEEAGALSYRVGPVIYDERDVHRNLDDQVIRADLLVVVGDTASPEGLLRTQLQSLGSVSIRTEGSTALGALGHGTIGEDENVPVLVLPSDPVAAALLFAALAVR